MNPPTIAQRRAAHDSLPPKIRKLLPDPEEDAVHALASELARPVMLGYLLPSEAYASLALQTVKLADPATALERCWKTLRSHVQWRHKARETVARRISTTLAPMIRDRRPRNALLAEAHGINGAVGFHFSEAEVNDLVEFEVWHALPPPPFRGRQYGR